MINQKRISGLLLTFFIASLFAGYFIMQNGSRISNVASAAIKRDVERSVNSTLAGDQYGPKIGIANDNSFVAAFTGPDTGGSGVYFRQFNGMYLPSGTDQLVNITTVGMQTLQDIAVDYNGNYIIVWNDNNNTGNYDLYMRAYLANGTAVGAPILITSTTSSAPISADIDLVYRYWQSPVPFVVTWTQTTGSNSDIHMQQYTMDFTTPAQPSAVGAETTVNSYTTGTQNNPATAIDYSSSYSFFVVSWEGAGSGVSGNHVWYQAYKWDGTAIGSNTRVDSTNISTGTNPKMAIGKFQAFGNDIIKFYITYAGISTDDTDYGIFVRSVTCNTAGTSCPLSTTEARVNTTTGGTQIQPAIDTDSMGNMTIVWLDQGPGTVNALIRGQSFKYNKFSRIGSEFTVNTTVNNAYEPSIAMNYDGQYIVTFESGATGVGNGKDIKYQRYVSDLQKVGTETLLHPANSSVSQNSVDVAVAPNGNYAAVYIDQATPPKVMVALYDRQSNPPVLTSEIQVDSGGTSNANPTISFFQDTAGDGAGRFVVAWEGVAPVCAGTGSGLDILYREIDSLGNLQGSCESIVNTATAGDQKNPDISAGEYHPSGDIVRDRFAIAYKSGDTDAISAYHDDTGFTFNTLDSGCVSTSCLKPRVAFMLPDYHNYVWDNYVSTSLRVFIRRAQAGTLRYAALQIGWSFLNEYGPDIATLNGSRFITTHTLEDISGPYMILSQLFDNAANTGSMRDYDVALRGSYIFTSPEIYTRIAASPTGFLIIWTDNPNTIESDQIFGKHYYTFGINPYAYTVGYIFRINSTQPGSQAMPAISMNSTGSALVGWEGTYGEYNAIDSNGAIWQGLSDITYTAPTQSLQPQAEQEITAGAKTVTVPTSISYSQASVNTSNPTEIQTSIRDSVAGGSDNKYIEIEDLDGAGFTFSAVINDNFLLGTTSYISKSAASIRNWDQSTTGTDGTCGSGSPLNCFLTLNSSASPTTFSLDAETQNFVSLDTQRILATKTDDHEIGRWRFYPEFKLNIPARTPPGSHTTTIIFTLI